MRWGRGNRFDDAESVDAAAASTAIGQRMARVVTAPGVYGRVDDAAAPPDSGVGGAGSGLGAAGSGLRDAGSGPGGGGVGSDEAGVDPVAARAALAAFDPGRRGIKVLAVIAVVVVLVVGFLVWRSRPRPIEVAPPAAAGSGAPQAAAPSAAGIVVAVAGRVHRPGLVRLPFGSRVADAIEAAGGVLPGTDLGYLNLARKLIDGELLVVGASPAPAPPGAGAGPGGPGPGGGSGPGAGAGPVNLNTATLAELETLPGVGPVLAQRIIDYRTSHGGFRSVEELRRVDGVGDARFAQLKDLVTV
jgi:competence protein ComEA